MVKYNVCIESLIAIGGMTMNVILKHFILENVIGGALSIILGILFILVPNSFANILVIVCGILLILGGLVFAVMFLRGSSDTRWLTLTGAIISIILGIFCLTHIDMIKGVLNTFFGIITICFGSIFLARSIDLIMKHVSGWLVPLIMSAVIVALGTIVLFGRFETIFVFTGIALIVSGIFTIIMSLLFNDKAKRAVKRNTPVDADWREAE